MKNRILAAAGLVLFTLLYLFGWNHLSLLPARIFGSAIDELSFLCIFDKLSGNLLHHPSRLFDGGILYPASESLLFSETMFLSGLTYRVILAACLGNKLLAFNLTVLGFFLGNFSAMYFFVRAFLPRPGAIVSSSIFTFALIRIAQAGHTHLMPQFFFPLTAWSIFRYEKNPSPKFLILAAVFTALQFWFSVTLGLFLVVTLMPYPIYRLFKKRPRTRFLKHVAIAGWSYIILVLPLAYPYSVVSKKYHFVRPIEEARIYSAHITNYFLVPPTHPYAPLLSSRKLQRALFARHEKNLFIGFAALILVGFALRRKQKVFKKEDAFLKSLVVITLLFVMWISLGPQAKLYSFLYYFVPGMKALRTPARLGLVYLFLMSIVAGVGFTKFWQLKLPHKKRILGAACFFLLFVWESHLTPFFSAIPDTLHSSTSFLKTHAPDEAIAHWPFDEQKDVLRWYASLAHEHPMINGYCGFIPPEHSQFFNALTAAETGMGNLDILRKHHVRYLILDKPWLGPERVALWNRQLRALRHAPAQEDAETLIVDLKE